MICNAFTIYYFCGVGVRRVGGVPGALHKHKTWKLIFRLPVKAHVSPLHA